MKRLVRGRMPHHPGGNPGANLKSNSHIFRPILVAFVWELTAETSDLPLGCLQGTKRNASARVVSSRMMAGSTTGALF